jgi:hypothetical protein
MVAEAIPEPNDYTSLTALSFVKRGIGAREQRSLPLQTEQGEHHANLHFDEYPDARGAPDPS